MAAKTVSGEKSANSGGNNVISIPIDKVINIYGSIINMYGKQVSRKPQINNIQKWC